MKLFKQITNLPESGTTDVAVIRLKQQMTRQIFAMVACLLIVGVAVFSFASRSWFATNRKVTNEDNSVVSDTASPSLFIRATGDTSKTYASLVRTSVGASLFPISTADLKNWYYASAFTYASQEVTNGNYTYVINTPAASEYTKITSFTSEDAGTYNNAYEQKERVAYYRSKVNLYTTTGPLDVYLNSVDPITVTYQSNATTPKSLLNALRVGIMVNNEMVLIYAPVAESGTGNSTGASANTFYTINNGALTAAGSTVKTSLTDYLAQLKTGSDTLYEATGSTKICQATEAGVDVTTYVWLEGTDAQALYGLSDEDLKGINVVVNYVGVESAS